MLRIWKRTVATIAGGLFLTATASATLITNHTAVDDFLSDQPANTTYFAGTDPGEWNDPFGTGFRRQLVLSNGISDGVMVFPFVNPILQYTNSVTDFSAFDVFYFDLARPNTGPTFFNFSVRAAGGSSYSLSFDEDDLLALSATPERLYIAFSDFENLAGVPINWEEVDRVSFGARTLTLHEWGVANFETLAVIPVPPTAALMLIGLAGLGLHRKRMAAKQ